MKIITWNMRGINSPKKEKIVRKKIQRTNPILVFLQETKCSASQLQKISKRMWKGSEGIDERGHAGGLGIFWDPHNVILSSFTGNHHFISAKFRVIGLSASRVLTNVYGPHNSIDKVDFIKSLESIHEWMEGRH